MTIDILTLKRAATELIALRGDRNKLHRWMDAKLAFDDALNPTTALALIERVEAAEAEIKRLREALLKFADHFGPLEDNIMLNEDARECFCLARDALVKP